MKQFYITTVKDDEETRLALEGCQEAGFILFASTGLGEGVARLYFQRDKIVGTPEFRNGFSKPEAVAAKARKR